MRCIFLIICNILICHSLFSTSKLEFERLNSNNGLSSEEIRNIFQDSDGFIWFITKEGLNRYDGHEIISYGPGMENLNFTTPAFESICEDHHNRLWLGTFENGLLIFDKNNYSVTTFEAFTNGHNLADHHIRSLLSDDKENIWIGTEYGLYKYHISSNELTYFNLGNLYATVPAWCIIESLIEDTKGNIWIGTWNMGLYIYDPDSGEMKSFNCFDKSKATNNDNRIKSLFEDSDQNIWVGTWEDGLYQVRLSDGELITDRYFLYNSNHDQTIAGDIIYSINQDDNNNLWIGTPYGLSIIENLYSVKPYFNNLSCEFGSPKGLSNNEVWKIYKDRSGLMWLGTLEGGVNKVHPNGKVFEGYTIPPISSQIYSQTVQSFCIDPSENFLVGVKSLGFGVYDLQNKDYKHYTELDAYKVLPSTINTVNCFLSESNTYLWLGTRYSGLIVHHQHKNKYVVLNELDDSFTYETVNVLCQTNDQSVWAGTENGLYKIVRCEEGMHCYEIEKIQNLNGSRINSIFQDHTGDVWIGTAENGLRRLKVGNNSELQFSVFDRQTNKIPTNRIQCVYEDSKNNIWVGTSDQGLLRYDASEKYFSKVEISKGLKTEKIFNIAEDASGSLWLTTNNGLTKLILKQGKLVADSYTVTNGLQGNIFVPGAMFIQNNNRIFVGGYYGFNSFFPSDVKPNMYEPPTLITEILINDNPVRYNFKEPESFVLSHKENDITFRFSAMSFYKPDKNTFSYKLEGLHEDWQFVDASIRMAKFPNLGAGSYTFYVKSANSSELWNQEPVKLELEILPAPFRTWWAYTGYSILILLVLILIYRYLLKNEKIKRALEIEKIEHAKSEKLNQFKLRFFTNISHEILTPLSIISCSVEWIKSQTRKGREEFKIIDRNINQLDRLLHQLLDFRKMEGGYLKLKVQKENFNSFIKQLVDNFTPLTIKHKLTLNLQQKGKSCHCWFDKDKLDKILDNLLSNAIKYTPLGGSILVTTNIIKIADQIHVEILVSDTGKGIEKENLNNIFQRFYRAEGEKEDTGTGIGLAYTKNLVQLHKGEITVTSEYGKGSTFKILIPVHREAFSKAELYEPEEVLNVATNEHFSANEYPDFNGNKLSVLKGSNITLLLVDDNSDFRNILSVHFSKYFKIIEASNGEQAYIKALKLQPDIIVCDVMMPKKDGFELCLDLKNNIDTQNIPVILVTAKADEEARTKGYSMGADSYITKPVSLSVLESRINALLLKHNNRIVTMHDESNPIFKNPKLPDHLFIKEIETYIQNEISDPELSVTDISKHLGMSDSMFYRRVKQLTQLSPVEYVRKTRLNKAASILKKGNANISEIAYSNGFSDQSYFTACFKKQFGSTPTEYMKAKVKIIARLDD